MANQLIDRFFDTVNQSSHAFFDAVKAGNERAYRFSKIAIEEAERTQSERADLARFWLQSPMDLAGLSNAVLETWTRRQRRRLELSRTFFDEMAGMRDETRDVLQRVASANRSAVQVGVSAGREAITRASEEISERAADVSEAASDAAQTIRRRNSSGKSRETEA